MCLGFSSHFEPFSGHLGHRSSRTILAPPLQRSRQGRVGAGRHQHKGRRRGTGSVEQVQDSESPGSGDQNGEIPGEIIHYPFIILMKSWLIAVKNKVNSVNKGCVAVKTWEHLGNHEKSWGNLLLNDGIFMLNDGI